MNRYYKIADFSFVISYPENEDFPVPDHFTLFETKICDVEYTYELKLVDELPFICGEPVAQRDALLVYEKDGLESRVIGFHGEDMKYACYQEISEEKAEICFLREMTGELYLDTMFNSLLALERRLLKHDAMILHCAYIIDDGEAILFSAPSETGKSTQAGLWHQYRNSRIVNGDRGLLQKMGEHWYVHGWPVCGSSEICYNESAQVRAIVMLSQASDNQVSLLRPMEAFRQLYSQITVNGWNQRAAGKVMDRIDSLITDIPVYHLACNISKDAVDTLAEVLL